MSPSRTARLCAAGVVVALVSPPLLNALTPLGDGLIVWTSLAASLACFVAAVAATYRAGRPGRTRTRGHLALAAGATFVAGLAYFQLTADEPAAIPVAGLALVLLGTIGLVVATSTLPSGSR